jgi:hypothetical protein
VQDNRKGLTSSNAADWLDDPDIYQSLKNKTRTISPGIPVCQASATVPEYPSIDDSVID